MYMIAAEKNHENDITQVVIILNCPGPDFISIYDRPDQLLEEYCAPKKNVVVIAYRFWNARWKEPFDAYFTELGTMAALCDYDEVQPT